VNSIVMQSDLDNERMADAEFHQCGRMGGGWEVMNVRYSML
jgi:hypothetical protein